MFRCNSEKKIIEATNGDTHFFQAVNNLTLVNSLLTEMM